METVAVGGMRVGGLLLLCSCAQLAAGPPHLTDGYINDAWHYSINLPPGWTGSGNTYTVTDPYRSYGAFFFVRAH